MTQSHFFPKLICFKKHDFILAPHLFVIAGKLINDLSLDNTISPSVATFTDWTAAAIWGRGRIVNDTFWVCGGGTVLNRSGFISKQYLLLMYPLAKLLNAEFKR